MSYLQKSVVFTGIRKVETLTENVDLTPPPTGLLFQTRYSCISAGTELAKLTGRQVVTFPLCLGNRAVGRVVDPGAHSGIKAGSLIFAHAAHSSIQPYSGFWAALPEEADCPEAALLGMAMVSLVGVQQVPAQLGDFAVVTGAGLVGNLAAQLLELSGVRAILVDREPGRLAVAKACGITHAIAGTPEEIGKQIAAITRGRGAEFGLECTGNPEVVGQLPAWVAQQGRVVLVGSPRGEGGDLTAFANHFHLWREHGDLTLVGAHEWKIPAQATPFLKHSMTRNAQILCDLWLGGRLKLKPLLSRVFRPTEAAEAYRLLEAESASVLGAVFDWSEA